MTVILEMSHDVHLIKYVCFHSRSSTFKIKFDYKTCPKWVLFLHVYEWGINCFCGEWLVCLLWVQKIIGWFSVQSIQTIKLEFADSSQTHSNEQQELDQNQDNLSEWSNLSTLRLLFYWPSIIKLYLSMLVYQY